MEYCVANNCGELYHHGILGMKWGVRRFQNKDGSLTAAGKKRRGEADSESGREETTEERRARVLKSVDAKEIYKNKDILTTAELNERINRIDTEARLKSKIVEEKTGMDYVNSKMKSTTDTINNASNFFKSVDNAFSSVANSAIGKTLAKQLGIETPKKEFNLEEFWKNRNSKTTQEIMDVNKRLMAEESIKKRLSDNNTDSKKNTEAEQKLKDAQKQVDDYVNSGAKNDRVTPTTYSKKGEDISDNKVGTGNKSNTSRLQIEQVDKYEATGRDVVGEGASHFSGWKDPPTRDAVYDGQQYVDSLLQLEDKSKK